jgi:hypothetical protein
VAIQGPAFWSALWNLDCAGIQNALNFGARSFAVDLVFQALPTSALPKMPIFGCTKACCAARQFAIPLRGNALRSPPCLHRRPKFPKVSAQRSFAWSHLLIRAACFLEALPRQRSTVGKKSAKCTRQVLVGCPKYRLRILGQAKPTHFPPDCSIRLASQKGVIRTWRSADDAVRPRR